MDYLGIVAVMNKDIGIAEIIDEIIGVHEYQKVTHGQSTMAMICNMLAILQRPLYLLSNFIDSKPVDRLLSKDIPADAFNDDVLGRTLDKLYEVGLESIFMRINSTVFKKYGNINPHIFM